MPRYVILTHDHPFPHWDLMLESEGMLRTWRLLEEPATGRTVPAEPLGEHRLAYLDYEGPVSGGRGSVMRWDSGTYSLLAEEAHCLRIQLVGNRLNGTAHLRVGTDGTWAFDGADLQT